MPFDLRTEEELRTAETLLDQLAPTGTTKEVLDLVDTPNSDGELLQLRYRFTSGAEFCATLREFDATRPLEWAWGLLPAGKKRYIAGEEFGAATLSEIADAMADFAAGRLKGRLGRKLL